jgi:hypothetical protein
VPVSLRLERPSARNSIHFEAGKCFSSWKNKLLKRVYVMQPYVHAGIFPRVFCCIAPLLQAPVSFREQPQDVAPCVMYSENALQPQTFLTALAPNCASRTARRRSTVSVVRYHTVEKNIRPSCCCQSLVSYGLVRDIQPPFIGGSQWFFRRGCLWRNECVNLRLVLHWEQQRSAAFWSGALKLRHWAEAPRSRPRRRTSRPLKSPPVAAEARTAVGVGLGTVGHVDTAGAFAADL